MKALLIFLSCFASACSMTQFSHRYPDGNEIRVTGISFMDKTALDGFKISADRGNIQSVELQSADQDISPQASAIVKAIVEGAVQGAIKP